MRLRSKLLVIFCVSILILLSALAGYVVVYAKIYEGKVYPGVYIGDYSLGGLTHDELVRFAENFNNRLSKNGLHLIVIDQNGEEHKITLNPILSGGDNAVELVRLNSDEFTREALAAGRSGLFLSRVWAPLWSRFLPPRRLLAPVTVNENSLIPALQGYLQKFEYPAQNAGVAFNGYLSAGYSITSEHAGVAFDYPPIIRQLKNNLSQLSFNPVRVTLTKYSPTITTKDIVAIASRLPALFAGGEFVLRYDDAANGETKAWPLYKSRLMQWLEVRMRQDGGAVFSLDEDQLKKYLSTIVKPAIEVAPQEAKFEIENGKVKEFQASRSGVTVSEEAAYQDIVAAFEARNFSLVANTTTVMIATLTVEPKLKTTEVNDFGIAEIIGAGTSTFKDSHTNRIKNIAHAVERLNGVLIKPDEEFSANKFAGPYTADNGYLPEQVIKGKEIKPEIGGGMCQIGTTLFRMAMNSGMDITQRRNHSLVVAYYSDPVNGNPGTDATLYEPQLDLKFKNDTGNYLLLQTAIDHKKQLLTFTLWGKPDGRKGWYTHPLVSKWIPAGDQQDILVDDGTLKLGETKCQNAFRGAVASFIYTRFTPGGEKVERRFDSFYRPLPKICMIGVKKGMATSTLTLPGILIPDAP